MTKNQGLLLGIALTLLLGIALATSTTVSATSDVILYAFDQNPAGSDEGNEWVTFHNPSNESVDIGNWTFESTHGTTAIEWIPEGTTLYSKAYYIYTPPYQWLDNQDESIILKDSEGEEIDRTPVKCDIKDDNRCWVRKNSEWVFEVKEEFEKPTPSPTLKPPPLTPSPSPDYTSSPSPTPTPSPILTPAPTPSPSPGYTPSAIPTLSPSPDYTPSPILTPHPNISENFKERVSLIAAIVTIVSSILVIIPGIFRKKCKKLSSAFFPLTILFLVILTVCVAIVIIIEFITMVFTIISAIFTGIIAISTIIIAIIAYLYAYHPKPIVFAHLSHKPLGVYVENVGRGIAKNGKITICSLEGRVVDEGEFERLYMFQRYEYPTDKDLPVDKLVNEKRQFIVKIDYEDDRGKSISYKEKISIPLRIYIKLQKNSEVTET